MPFTVLHDSFCRVGILFEDRIDRFGQSIIVAFGEWAVPGRAAGFAFRFEADLLFGCEGDRFESEPLGAHLISGLIEVVPGSFHTAIQPFYGTSSCLP